MRAFINAFEQPDRGQEEVSEDHPMYTKVSPCTHSLARRPLRTGLFFSSSTKGASLGDVPFPGQLTSVGGQLTSVGGQLASVGGQLTSVWGQLTLVGSQLTSVGGQLTSVGGQLTSVRSQLTSAVGTSVMRQVRFFFPLLRDVLLPGPAIIPGPARVHRGHRVVPVHVPQSQWGAGYCSCPGPHWALSVNKNDSTNDSTLTPT